MHDVVAQKSRISQSAGGGGAGTMRRVRGDGSQFGQASVGSIHIGDAKPACPVCANPIAADNRSVVCFECDARFCETCEGYFRSERQRGESPLCRGCLAKHQRLVEEERLRRQQEEERRKQEEAARQPQAGEPWTSPSGIEFVHLPAGTFTMGSAEEGDATPHQVTLSRPFLMGKYPVTQREWASVMGSNPSYFKGDDRPVEEVSWNDCREFIRKLNAREGTNNYRLPTEAEWEYACRAGSRTRFCFGDGEHLLSQYVWCLGNSDKQTHPVGQLSPNDWDLYDMHGNVWERCYDWYGKYPKSSVTDPSGAKDGTYRVRRGGSWLFVAENCTSASRYFFVPSYRFHDIGFRLARFL